MRLNSLDDIILLNRTKSKALGDALDISNAIPKNSDVTIQGTDDYSRNKKFRYCNNCDS